LAKLFQIELFKFDFKNFKVEFEKFDWKSLDHHPLIGLYSFLSTHLLI